MSMTAIHVSYVDQELSITPVPSAGRVGSSVGVVWTANLPITV